MLNYICFIAKLQVLISLFVGILCVIKRIVILPTLRIVSVCGGVLMLGERIKEFRSARGWTQGVLAEKLDVSIGYISEIETGRRTPSLSTLLTIIDLLGCSPNDIFEFQVKREDNDLCGDCEFGNIDDTIRATVSMMRTMGPEERFKVFTYAKDQRYISEYFREKGRQSTSVK